MRPCAVGLCAAAGLILCMKRIPPMMQTLFGAAVAKCSIGMAFVVLACSADTRPSLASESPAEDELLLEDSFDSLKSGYLLGPVGAHTEYHYLSASAPKGPWSVTTFTSRVASQLAWQAFRVHGDAVLAQTYDNVKTKHAHPMVVAGDPAWRDYRIDVTFAPQSIRARSGAVFRYRNDRCYYFFGVDGPRAILMMVRHATAYREPYRKILASSPTTWKTGTPLTATIKVHGSRIETTLDNGTSLACDDDTYPRGRIGLLADVPTHYFQVRVTTDREEAKRIRRDVGRRRREQRRIQQDNPRPVLWKRFSTEGFGVGRNLRFGDLDGDGSIDILVGQVVHHGPKDRNSELSCLTALTTDGRILWQIGEPDAWKDHLTNDVGFQIHDLDGDGSAEVVYCRNLELIVADGATGATKYKTATPATPPTSPAPYNRFPRILGDAIFFCDLRGTGSDRDIVLKDRYRHFWALNDRLDVMWSGRCNTGHYPFASDVDHDGRDELAVGYSLYDDDGTLLWSLDKQVKDHADGVAVVDFLSEKRSVPKLLYAASDEGMFFTDMHGHILKHHYIGHVQNPAVADLRGDLPGLEAISINFWGNQGIVHVFDAHGNIVHDFEPCQHGSMCLPINWTGRVPEYFVLSANVEEGGMFDARGRRVVRFPNDGHPDMCNAVLDMIGDCRDEIVVWDPHEIWIYTQHDNPRPGRLYDPVRNPLYNYSNYQVTVSRPGWSE